jgi:hypothetical protein
LSNSKWRTHANASSDGTVSELTAPGHKGTTRTLKGIAWDVGVNAVIARIMRIIYNVKVKGKVVLN